MGRTPGAGLGFGVPEVQALWVWVFETPSALTFNQLRLGAGPARRVWRQGGETGASSRVPSPSRRASGSTSLPTPVWPGAHGQGTNTIKDDDLN